MASITRGPTRAGTRRTDTAQRVLEAAQRLLAGGASFTELGVQRIADEAGVARSSFYAHFPDKTQLLLTLARRLSLVAYDAHAGWEPDGEAALPTMVDGFVAVVAHYRANARVMAAVLEVAGYDPDVRALWDDQLAAFRDRVRGWLEAERAAGRCSPQLDPDAAARVVVDGGMRTIADQVVNGDPADDERLARELGLIWWFGTFRRP
jgi:AcrR family transcriptional regulator